MRYYLKHDTILSSMSADKMGCYSEHLNPPLRIHTYDSQWDGLNLAVNYTVSSTNVLLGAVRAKCKFSLNSVEGGRYLSVSRLTVRPSY